MTKIIAIAECIVENTKGEVITVEPDQSADVNEEAAARLVGLKAAVYADEVEAAAPKAGKTAKGKARKAKPVIQDPDEPPTTAKFIKSEDGEPKKSASMDVL